MPRTIYLVGNLTAALRFFKGWVRKDANLGLRTGCMRGEMEPPSKLLVGIIWLPKAMFLLSRHWGAIVKGGY